MITTLAVLLNTILGAMLRRWIGGWDPWGWQAPLGRTLKHLATALLCWPFFVVLPWYWALAATAVVFAYLHIRHDNGGPGLRPLWRYQVFGLGYIIARQFADKLPSTGRDRAFLEPYCWTCYGEVWLGATLFGAIALSTAFR